MFTLQTSIVCQAGWAGVISNEASGTIETEKTTIEALFEESVTRVTHNRLYSRDKCLHNKNIGVFAILNLKLD